MIDSRVSAYRTLASESRVEILHVLQKRGAAMPVDEIAPAVGLHVNTAREHLDRLVAGGFVERAAEVRTTRGRPRLLYSSVEQLPAATTDAQAREHLSRMLVAGFGQQMDSPAGAARQAGRAWADELAPGVAVPEPLAATDVDRAGHPVAAWRQLLALEQHFAELGFDPEADTERLEVHLRHCPFYDLAHERAEVVCSVHQGLAEGLLAQHPGPLTAVRLAPFVGPRHCVLHLSEG